MCQMRTHVIRFHITYQVQTFATPVMIMIMMFHRYYLCHHSDTEAHCIGEDIPHIDETNAYLQGICQAVLRRCNVQNHHAEVDPKPSTTNQI